MRMHAPRRVLSALALLAAVGGLLLAWPTITGATGTLVSQAQIKISATGTSASGLGTQDDPISLDWTQLFASGTGANQASNMFHDRRTISASSSEDLDLAGSLTNKLGTTLTFTKIKALFVRAASANTNDVVLGNASSNGFATPFGGATHTIKVKPGGVLILMAPDANGYAVTAATGDLLHVANSSSGTSVTYDIVIVGID